MTPNRQAAAKRKANRRFPRRATPTCQEQQPLTDDVTGTDPHQGPEPATGHTQHTGEPVKRTSRKPHRSQRAEDWAHADVAQLYEPVAYCVLCGTPALLRDPYTKQPCHLTCAQAQATERGEPW